MADNESAIICDLAQFYNIYDWRTFDIAYIATLVCGLPAESRVMKAVADNPYTLDTMMNAIIADYLSNLLYVEIRKSTKKKVQQPKSMLEILIASKSDETAKKELTTFATPDEFERARREIIEG